MKFGQDWLVVEILLGLVIGGIVAFSVMSVLWKKGKRVEDDHVAIGLLLVIGVGFLFAFVFGVFGLLFAGYLLGGVIGVMVWHGLSDDHRDEFVKFIVREWEKQKDKKSQAKETSGGGGEMFMRVLSGFFGAALGFCVGFFISVVGVMGMTDTGANQSGMSNALLLVQLFFAFCGFIWGFRKR